MAKILLSLLAGIIAGVTVTVFTRPAVPTAAGLADAADLGLRVAALETALRSERQARLALEATVAALDESLPGSAGVRASGAPVASGACTAPTGDPLGAAACAPAAAFADAGTDTRPVPAAGPGPLRRPGDGRDLGERLVAAGFTPARSTEVVDRVEALRLELLQARYDARRSGDASGLRGRDSIDAVLRAELGEADYERYLTAIGRPADVAIGDVLANSPAAAAGFEPGDRIVGYGGQRVFDMNQLTELTFAGEPGETVAVDVLRDGQTIQLYLPRGPLGISGGRGFRGPR